LQEGIECCNVAGIAAKIGGLVGVTQGFQHLVWSVAHINNGLINLRGAGIITWNYRCEPPYPPITPIF
jgi:hypothetical protein